MGLRNWLKRLERDSRGDLPSFELEDGSRYYHTQRNHADLYLFYHYCLGKHPDSEAWAPVPEALLKTLEARDPAEAVEAIGARSYEDIFPFDFDAIIRDRKLVPRSLAPNGRDPYDDWEIDDLSEPSSESGEVGV
jgi:hypothetical protein